MDAKLQADKALVTYNARRGSKYTIVLPNLLSQDPATGNIFAGKIHIVNTISREDVARVILACIIYDRTLGLAFYVMVVKYP